jgi:hypothetical protein
MADLVGQQGLELGAGGQVAVLAGQRLLQARNMAKMSSR